MLNTPAPLNLLMWICCLIVLTPVILAAGVVALAGATLVLPIQMSLSRFGLTGGFRTPLRLLGAPTRALAGRLA